MIKFNKILVLAPHTDDGEIGAGALINKLINEGADVHYIAFSTCEESVPEGLPKGILSEEVIKATSKLGISEAQVTAWKFPVRYFPKVRQEILEKMVQKRKEIRPDLVLMPASFDCHQDHFTIYQEGVRAFKGCTMLGYEVAWNNIKFEANLLVEVDQKNINAKKAAFDEYKSQGMRPYKSSDLENLAKVRGMQIGVPFAEAFNVIRWIWK
ncbi:PIG-L deacetylase family protein [Vibrio rotiferianus]|uniref:PIG-L deacetylase family protein n=1 Tax=Vibrio rotiferianus TaxID=190895 RepID=UPI00148E0FD9|nr:PIG-L family deacetylase [Vibrio rotiferianus]NOH65229.1 PIG-L family deacetylase [Vibrio rotiferianus]CAH1528178.1 LmbE family protein [Vibrio rotiferianus]